MLKPRLAKMTWPSPPLDDEEKVIQTISSIDWTEEACADLISLMPK